MREYYDYGVHRIELDLIQIRPGRFRWLYMIDGERIGRNIDVLQDIDTARATALRLAVREIDDIGARAPAMQSPAFARADDGSGRAGMRAA